MFSTIELILLLCVLLYITDILWLRIGLLRTSSKKELQKLVFPFVTVVVAARNEEKNILQCLESLSQLEYPQDKIEIIVVDDRSTDKTSSIVTTFIKQFSHFRLIQITTEGTTIKGKANALAVALDEARGEIFMFTDADCSVSSKWVKTTIKNFGDSIGIVGSYTLLNAENTFEGIQALDWLIHFSVSAALAGNNVPLTVIGNNFSISKKAYDGVNGFRGIPFSITEDYALALAVLKQTKFRVKFLLNSETLVKSFPCETWKQIYRQKQRWGFGANEMVLPGIIVIGLGYITHLLLLCSFFLVPVMFLWKLFAAKFLADIFLLWKPMKEFRARRLLKYFIPFEIYFYLYGLLFPFVILFTKNVTWKERQF